MFGLYFGAICMFAVAIIGLIGGIEWKKTSNRVEPGTMNN
jgi:hypothetical protein